MDAQPRAASLPPPSAFLSCPHLLRSASIDRTSNTHPRPVPIFSRPRQPMQTRPPSSHRAFCISELIPRPKQKSKSRTGPQASTLTQQSSITSRSQQVNSYAQAVAKSSKNDRGKTGAGIRKRNSAKFARAHAATSRSFSDGIMSYCTGTMSSSGSGEVSMRRISEALADAGIMCFDGTKVQTGQVCLHRVINCHVPSVDACFRASRQSGLTLMT